jgi:uncharacterized linocin/CFP29 family protein
MSWKDREAAPFGQEIWDQIDGTVRAAADEVRAARRLLEVVGPLGFQSRAGIAEDEPVAGDAPDEAEDRVHLHVPRVRPMPVLHATFSLGARAVAGREPLVLVEAAQAARRIGRAEDRLLFEGSTGARIRGLLGQDGALDITPGDWSDPARAADDLLGALARLEAAGGHGAFAAAISPARFYQLLRPHPGTALTPYQQLLPAFLGGIVKAPALGDGAVIVLRGPSGPRAALGQELTAAYDGREGIFHRISLVESVTLLPGLPGSVAVLRGAVA